MPENCLFTGNVKYELPVWREFQKGYMFNSNRIRFSRIISMAGLLFVLWGMQFAEIANIGLFYSIFLGVFLGINYINIHTGGTAYKRMLTNNRGLPPQVFLQFTENEILFSDENGVLRGSNLYNQVRTIAETKNFYILILQYQQGIPIRKDSLEGGTAEEFLTFLGKHSVEWKSKRCRTGMVGKIIECINIALIVAALLLSLCSSLGIPLYDRLIGRLTNDVGYTEMAQALEKVDIHINSKTIQEIEDYDAEYYRKNGEGYYENSPKGYKVYDLLYWEGCGVWNEETWEWTPSTSGVYYMDTEVWNVETMYTDFFSGLSAMDPELQFTNVTEDYSGADLEAGTGTVEISFDYNGTHHQLTAEYTYDWLDLDVITEVAWILARDDSDQELFACPDGQGLLFYYGTEKQVRQLRHMTVLEFTMVLFLNGE